MISPAADHRPAWRPRADRPRGPRRGAVRGQPARRVRRPLRAADARASWRHPRASAPRRSSCVLLVPVPPVMIAVAVVFWLSLSFGGPFHLRLWGVMYPARLRGRVVGFSGWAARRPAAMAALAGGLLADRLGGPTASSRSPASSGSRVPSGTPSSAPVDAGGRRASRARDSIRALRERPVLAGSPWPRGSTAAASSPRRRCTPSSTSTGSSCRSPTSGSSAS